MSEVKNKEVIESITEAARDLDLFFDQMEQLPGMMDPSMDRYRVACREIPRQIEEGLIKIAVVGAIKSGKTTLVNALLGEDLLKRGAGVLTAIVTRVRHGERLKATIFFKSWDEINDEIQKALLFIPDMAVNRGSELEEGHGKAFDLRRQSDRQFLKAAKMRLSSDISLTDGGLRPESSLIANAVDGYDVVRPYVQADPVSITFSGDDFDRHCLFTGDGGAAFFVRDVVLEIPDTSGDIDVGGHINAGGHIDADGHINAGGHIDADGHINAGDHIDADGHINVGGHIDAGGDINETSSIHTLAEIADCQGSDAIDPSHIIQIQHYLISANLLIYVISSRTGLREADLRFLRMIQSMGIIQNTLFVLNVDISEHDTLDELKTVEKKVKSGLGYFVESPKIYTFSTLFDLFSHTVSTLPSKASDRLNQWKKEGVLLDYCLEEGRAFQKDLNHLVSNQYHAILLENPIGRLTVLAQKAKNRCHMFRELFSNDLTRAAAAAERLDTLRTRSTQFEALMDNAIDNALTRLKQNASAQVHGFFDHRQGEAAGKVRHFILEYPIYGDQYEAMIPVSGFQQALYTMYHDFRRALDRFMATHFTPLLAVFVQQQEKAIEEAFQALYRSCTMDFSDLYGETHTMGSYTKEGASKERWGEKSGEMTLGEGGSPELSRDRIPVDLDAAKRILGLEFPRLSFAAGYSARVKVDAVARLGFYSMLEVFGKLMNLLVRPARSTTLKGAAKQIRKEILRAMADFLTVYRDQVIKTYLLPLLQATARDFREKMMEIFEMSQVESREIEAIIFNDRSENEAHLKSLDLMEHEIASVIHRVEDIVVANRLSAASVGHVAQ